MRIAHVVFAGALAAGTMLALPALAKNAEAQKNEDKSTASSCNAYQQAADGSWEQLPCKEAGDRGQPQATQHKPTAHGADQDER